MSPAGFRVLWSDVGLKGTMNTDGWSEAAVRDIDPLGISPKGAAWRFDHRAIHTHLTRNEMSIRPTAVREQQHFPAGTAVDRGG
jgi:hypothetical protein